MGNKRKRTKQRVKLSPSTHNDKIWPDRIVDELLSYLHSQIGFLDPATESRRERELLEVDQELAQHLNSWRNAGEASFEQLYEYSSKQIRAKLPRLYKQDSQNRNSDWKAIYIQGFACLDWTHDSERERRLIQRSKEIKHAWKWDFLHSPRKTRASSRVSGKLSSRKVFRESSSALGSRKRVGNSEAATEYERDAVVEDIATSNAGLVPKENREAIIATTELANQKPSVSSDLVQYKVRTARPLIKDSQEVPESDTDAFGTPMRLSSPAGYGNTRSEENLAWSSQSQKLQERLHDTEKELRMLKNKVGLEIDFWKARYCAAQHEGLRWREAKDALVEELNSIQGLNRKEFPSADLVEHKALIDALLDERNSHKRFRYLKPELSSTIDDRTSRKIFELMREIDYRLKVALQDAKFSPRTKIGTLPQDHLLTSLTERALGVEQGSSETIRMLESWHGEHGLLLALCGAALAHWVFQQTQADLLFDRFQDVGTRSSKNRYRDAIQLLGHTNPALAREIDLTVHQNLMSEGCFEEIQRAKARDLAHKLQEALAPLCELDSDTGEQSDTDSMADGHAVDQLSVAFFSAIDVQWRLVLTGRRFQYAWYKPGTPFDKARMRSHEERRGGAAGTSNVRLTLLPGIDQITGDKISVEFGGFAERRHKDYEEAVCLIQAVVQCDSEQ